MFNAAAAPGQTVLTVGPGKEYQTIAAAVQAAANGDLILVQPGTYTNDFADISRSVTIAGAGGLVTIDAAEAPPNEKGIFVIDASVQIDNVVFEGAAIPVSEGGNGAGIRYQGGAMVLHNDAFIGNQNGILAAAVDNLPVNTITITGCTFDNNGNSTGPDAGFTHNCYISTGVTTLTATHDVFERANVGHELKSRAQTNIITNNIFYDGPTGTASYSIDLPDGGRDTVSGNIIEKGPEAENDAIIHFGGEGIPYAGSTLSITGNTIINDLGANAVLLLNQTTIAASIMHNTLDKFAGATIGQGVYTQSGNVDQNGDPIAPSSSGSFAPGTNLDDFSQDSSPHTVTLTSQTGVLGGGGLLTVFTQAGHVTVVGGAGGLDYQEAAGFGGSQITTAAGARDTVVAPGQDQIASNGRDSITLGDGNVTMQVDGAASIAAGSGNSAFVVNGQASITGGDGGDTVQVNGPGAASIGGALSYLQVAMNGGSAALGVSQGGGLDQMTIRGGASETAIYNAGMNVTTAGAGAGAAISFGGGVEQWRRHHPRRQRRGHRDRVRIRAGLCRQRNAVGVRPVGNRAGLRLCRGRIGVSGRRYRRHRLFRQRHGQCAGCRAQQRDPAGRGRADERDRRQRSGCDGRQRRPGVRELGRGRHYHHHGRRARHAELRRVLRGGQQRHRSDRRGVG
jgi:hypothetical protein